MRTYRAHHQIQGKERQDHTDRQSPPERGDLHTRPPIGLVFVGRRTMPASDLRVTSTIISGHHRMPEHRSARPAGSRPPAIRDEHSRRRSDCLTRRPWVLARRSRAWPDRIACRLAYAPNGTKPERLGGIADAAGRSNSPCSPARMG
uniref:Uncharacterized protein n=1 Tax=Streptomyces sp. F12 TaxID=1436084 RepID=V9Z888_9ACTN|nr:hypothetical protein pFRL6_226 [Streptomyces sp. F12]